MTNESCDARMIAVPSLPIAPHKLPWLDVNERTLTAADVVSTDAEVLSAASAALHQTGYDQLRAVKLYCHDGRIVMQGSISTHYLKQFAQDVVRLVPNVKEIDNDLRVVCSR